MSRFSSRIPAAALYVLCAALCCGAQNGGTPALGTSVVPIPSDDSGKSYPTKPLQTSDVVRAPFALDRRSAPGEAAVRIVTDDEMRPEDRDLATGEEPAIRAAAALAGMEMTRGAWRREQLDCQSFPDHVFLLFENDNGRGDASVFTASVSRAGNHFVRVFALERRGYALYTPAPVNPLVMAEFNAIRAAEPKRNEQDWLATGLCYAALTGAVPESTGENRGEGGTVLPLSFPPTLEVDGRGGATVRFVDATKQPQAMQWALQFDAQGKLLGVEHFPTPAYAVTDLAPAREGYATKTIAK